MSRTRLTNRQRFEIETYIAANGDETDDGWKYKTGMSDGAVAQKFAATQKTIANLRNKTFGALAGGPAARVAKIDLINDRLDEIERRLGQVEEQYTAPIKEKPENWLKKPVGNGIITEGGL